MHEPEPASITPDSVQEPLASPGVYNAALDMSEDQRAVFMQRAGLTGVNAAIKK